MSIELIKQFKRDYAGYYVVADQIFKADFNKNVFYINIERIVGGG